jgi:arylsulfatase A-like enzyme
MIGNSLLLTIATGCGGSPDGPGPGSPDPAVPPNVLVILLDDVGTDKVAAYGEHPQPASTPHLDALAAQGVLFRHAWASATCEPSRGALLTGRYGRRYGLGQTDTAYDGRYQLPLSEVTIPEMLGSAPDEWSSSLVGKWHLATYGSADNLAHPGLQGFDWYHSVVSNLNEGVDPSGRGTYYDWELNDNGVIVPMVDTYVTTRQVDDALDRMAVMPEPWLLYLSLNAAHTPLAEPPPELLPVATDLPDDLEELGVRYHQALQAADTELGRLLAEVDLERTVVIALGDNGTPEHAVLPPLIPSRSKQSLFEGGINVPLIVAGPPVAEPGSESGALVHLVDVFATVAELAGVDLAALRGGDGEPVVIDGQSLVPFLRDPGAAGREVVYAEKFSPNGAVVPESDQRTVRDDRFKLLVSLEGGSALFDLEGRTDDGPDLLSSGPLSPEAAEAYERLSSAMRGFEADLR